jgi:CBS domain-containing protein
MSERADLWADLAPRLFSVPSRNITVAEAGPRVADLMLRSPRTVSPETTVAEAREAIVNDRERMLVVTREGRYVGAVPRDAVTDDLDDALTLEALLDARVPRVAPDDAAARALDLLDRQEYDRLPVVAPDGTLAGLVCFSRSQGTFCVER